MRLKCAVWRPVDYGPLSRRTDNAAAVMHTNGFATVSLFNAWTKQAAAGSTKGSHFQITNAGTIEQYVDTDFVLGHAFDANPFTVGIETQDDGDCHKPWTDAQVQAILKVLRELKVPGKKLEVGPSDGVGWHRQFDEWNHNDHECPCDERQAQINAVIIPALNAPPPEEDDLALTGKQEDALAGLWGFQRRQKVGPGSRPLDGSYKEEDAAKTDRTDSAKAGWDLADHLLKLPTP